MRSFHLKREQLKFSKDIIINIFAISVRSAVLNLIIYPLLARYFASEAYGMILTALGVINILFSSLGNSLNNVRLITNRKVGEANKNNPYNLIIIASSFLGAFIGTGIILYIYPLTFLTSLFIACTIFVGIIRAYFIVEFRLQINYVKELISNIILSTGYIVGILLIKKVDYWPIPFLLGELFSLIFTYFNTELVHEGVLNKKDDDGIGKAYLLLVSTNILGNVITYLDRFIIYPLLGASYVSIFTVACLWGKIFSPFIAPVANVILSYLSKAGTVISLRRFKLMFLVTLIPIILLCLGGIFIAPFLTRLLYPSLVDEAEPYIFLASTGSLVGCAINLIMPMIMMVCSMKDLLIFQAIHFFTYILIAYIGISLNGLMGFCYAILIINILKVIMYYSVGLSRVKKQNQ